MIIIMIIIIDIVKPKIIMLNLSHLTVDILKDVPEVHCHHQWYP